MEKPHPPTIKKGAAYPKEFRTEAVQYWISSGKKAKVVAEELGVSDWSLNRWRLNRWRQEMEQAGEAPESLAPHPGEKNALELAKENGRLRREVEALTRQRDILKKAIGIFSAENPNGGSR
jgi:transposase